MPFERASIAFRAAAVLLLCGPGSSGAGEVIERIAAVVDGRPVLLSEVGLLARVRGVDYKTALEGLIDERLMFREASRLSQAAVTPADEERAYTSLVARAEGPRGLPEAELRRLARRQTAILKYVEFRFRPQVRITDEAVRRAYDVEYGAGENAPSFEAVAEDLRENLIRRALDEKIEAWVKDLRTSAEIRYNP